LSAVASIGIAIELRVIIQPCGIETPQLLKSRLSGNWLLGQILHSGNPVYQA
jgi:hypothetical protein